MVPDPPNSAMSWGTRPLTLGLWETLRIQQIPTVPCVGICHFLVCWVCAKVSTPWCGGCIQGCPRHAWLARNIYSENQTDKPCPSSPAVGHPSLDNTGSHRFSQSRSFSAVQAVLEKAELTQNDCFGTRNRWFFFFSVPRMTQ